ncbi:hypothetical protein L2726_004703 [Vibrio parahaemolyticus]|nr:hypothetical protein [Vibrio parahaemolyticus]EIT7132097.1 hypothetical protein [Vibrio parahaemolyticus]EIZ4252561.1 hypothetical protein [Vibrio parahaemolyticus]
MKQTLESKLAHSHAAYIFAIRSLPTPDQKLPLTLNGVTFSSESQINSMLIELGWSFFCRYEGCLEAHIKELGIKLTKKVTLADWLLENKISVPSDYASGLDVYRTIRNKLHHEDGAALNGNDKHEIHILPEHMERFYRLFVWCGAQMESVMWAEKNKI